MKIILKNTSMVFQKEESDPNVLKVTNSFGALTLGMNVISGSSSSTSASTMGNDALNIKTLVDSDGYTKIRVVPKTNKKVYLQGKLSETTQTLSSGGFVEESTTLDIPYTDSRWGAATSFDIYLCCRTTPEAAVAGMSTNLADWADIYLIKPNNA